MNFINIGIRFYYRGIAAFGQVMDFGTGYLIFQATYNRRSKYNIAYGTKPNNQKFNHVTYLLAVLIVADIFKKKQ